MSKFDYEAVKDILRCPKSLSPVVHEGDSLVCIDPECRLQYPILDGIPNLLVDDATEVPADSWQEVISRHDLTHFSDSSESHLADS